VYKNKSLEVHQPKQWVISEKGNITTTFEVVCLFILIMNVVFFGGHII
jgi:hypothetical protein